MLEAEGEALEQAAHKLAPDFDYEKEALAIALEEQSSETLEEPGSEPMEEQGSETLEEQGSEVAASEAASEEKQNSDKPLPPAKVSPSKYPRPRYEAKTALGRVFLKDRHQLVFGITLLMLIAVVGWWSYDFLLPRLQAEKTTAMIGGKRVEFKMIPGTVEENLEFNDIEYDSDDEIVPALDKELKSGTELVVNYVEYKTVQKTEEVKAENLVQLDPELDSGVEKRDRGNDGSGVFSYSTKYVNGKKSGTERKLDRWIVEPHNTVLRLGTKRTGHSGTYEIVETFTANCSAYWMGNNCYGAGGGKCVYGTVAVDHSRFEYGTKFWIEGYGYAVANDCGTSIKGDKLDLWMDSFAESCRWGRRHMTTYVLKEVK